jgi:hypothetical protein
MLELIDLLNRIATGTTTEEDCREVERMAAMLSRLQEFVHDVSLFCDDQQYADLASRLLGVKMNKSDSRNVERASR